MQNIIYREVPKFRKFGVELEVIKNISKLKLGDIIYKASEIYGHTKFIEITSGSKGWAESKDNNYWHVKYDSSCGWEIASFVAQGNSDIDYIAFVADILGYYGAKVDVRCGFHIHVNVNDFSVREMGNLLGRWVKVEKFIKHCCSESRFDNYYCKGIESIISQKKIDKNSFNPYYFWEEIRPTDFAVHQNDQKKRAINTVGYAASLAGYDAHRPTIELRLPECQLNSEHVSNWIRLFLNFVDFSKNSDSPKDLNECQSISELLCCIGLQQEPISILEPELFETKLWFLKKINKSTLSEELKKQIENDILLEIDI